MTAPEGAAAANPLFTAANIAALVWLIGIALMLLWAFASWMGLRSRMSTAVRLEGEVYESEFAASPFVLGVFRPRIYLPYGLREGERAYILAHERAHIARRDTWFKPLGFLVLTLHWYNPLVWLAWTLYCRDVEYACDERAVKNLAAEQRAEYSEALLKCSTPGRRAAACPLAFGESDAKGPRQKRAQLPQAGLLDYPGRRGAYNRPGRLLPHESRLARGGSRGRGPARKPRRGLPRGDNRRRARLRRGRREAHSRGRRGGDGRGDYAALSGHERRLGPP